MSRYVLDTDICIYWLKGNEAIKKRVERVGPGNLMVTMFTLAELNYGAYYSQHVEKNLQNIQIFLSKIKVIDFDETAADYFGKIKADLRQNGQLIEDLDILIASTVLSHGAVLVTNNTSHFSRIQELTQENWTQYVPD